MKVFALSPGYPDADNPITNIFVCEQVNALNEIGNDMTVLDTKILPTSKIFKKISRRIKVNHDVNAIRYTKAMKSFMYRTFPRIYSWQYMNNVSSLYRAAVEDRGKPDVLFAHFSCYAGYAACKIGEKYDIPVVTVEHGGYFLKNKVGSWQKSCLIYTIEHSKAFLCVSEGQRKCIERIAGKHSNIAVVPNIIDKRFIYSPKSKNDRFVFLSVANLYKGKRIDLLVRAFCEVFADDGDTVLYICGEGEERANIERIIKEHNKEKHVILIGRLDRETVIDKYKECDCFVLPSEHETYGIVYREALCTGRPVITTDHSGFSDIDWQEEFGLKIPIDDLSALKKAMRYMRGNISKYDGKSISEKCLKICSGDTVRQILHDYLRQAVKQ